MKSQSGFECWAVLLLAVSWNPVRYPLKEQPESKPRYTLHLLADHETSIRFLREDARKCSEDFEDEGTSDLLVNVMRMHEKNAWMLRSFIENEIIIAKIPDRPRS